MRIIHVGLLCVQEGATDRPTTSDVISMLNNETMVLPAPTRPTFFTGRNVTHTTTSEYPSHNYLRIRMQAKRLFEE